MAYAAAVTLAVVAALGLTMAARWVRVYRAHDAAAVRGEYAGITVPPERNFPLPVVIGHGIFAGATIVLVVLTAVGEFSGS